MQGKKKEKMAEEENKNANDVNANWYRWREEKASSWLNMNESNERTTGTLTEMGKGMREGLEKEDKGVQTSFMFSASKIEETEGRKAFVTYYGSMSAKGAGESPRIRDQRQGQIPLT